MACIRRFPECRRREGNRACKARSKVPFYSGLRPLWPLYGYNPELRAQGKNPLVIDSKDPSPPVAEYIYGENRYRMLRTAHPDLAARLPEQKE